MKVSTVIMVITILVLLIGIGILVAWNSSKTTKIVEQSNNINALNSELTVIRNRDSSMTATIQAFETDEIADFLAIKSKDSTIEALQALVEKNKKKDVVAAITFKTEGSIKETFKTTPIDSTLDWGNIALKDDGRTRKLWEHAIGKPVYHTPFKTRWYWGNIVSSSDSTTLELTYTDDYELVLGREKGKTYGDITSKSPHNAIKTARVYVNSVPKPSGWGIGAHAGLGAMYVNGQVYGGIVISVGLNKNIIKFK